MDYLLSVVGHLAGEPEPRDLKYAVLHLQAAAEVLLKSRLLQEHWSLVFKDPGRSSAKQFQSGDFDSCGTAETIDRLRRHRRCRGQREGRQSPQGPGEVAERSPALWADGVRQRRRGACRRGAVDFLLRFVHEHLLPGLEEEAEPLMADMQVVRETLVKSSLSSRRG